MASQLTEEEKVKAKGVWDKYDKDKSGTVDKEEFVTMMSVLLDIDPENTRTYLNVKFRSADKDLSGALSYDEFIDMYAKMKDRINA